MTILLINYPEIKEFLDSKWVEDLWVVDTNRDDAEENMEVYNPDYIICSSRDDAQYLGGFWHEDIRVIKEIINGVL